MKKKIVSMVTQLEGLKVVAMMPQLIITLTVIRTQERMKLRDLPETDNCQVKLIQATN